MSFVHAFASPMEELSAHAAALVAAKQFKQTRDRLLRSFDGTTDACLAQALAETHSEPSACWQPALGIAGIAVRAGRPVVGALQLIAMAPPSKLELALTLAEPACLYLDGYSLPLHGEVVLSKQRGRLRVQSRTATFERDAETGVWAPIFVEVGACHVHTLAHGSARYLVESSVSGSASIFPDPLATPALVGSPAQECDTIAQALALLVESAPAQRQWLSSAIDGLLLVRGNGAALSNPDFPGLLALARGRTLLDYVEALAGGACHQKLFQLALIFALTESGREEVSYVPPRRSYTTTRRALAAAHEHVNVIQALCGLIGTPGAPAGLHERIERRRLMLAVDCVPALDASMILTKAGAELWQRLREVGGMGATREWQLHGHEEHTMTAECGI